MGNHFRFKDEEDEEMDATRTEEEETQNNKNEGIHNNDDDDDDMLDDEPAHDFGPDPEFMVRKPEANLMMFGGAAVMTSSSNATSAREEEEEEDKGGTTMRRGGASAASLPSSSSPPSVFLKLQCKHKEKGAVYITQMESNFDFSKVCYRTSANEAKVFDVHSARAAAAAVPLVRHERAVTDAHFPVPNELTTILSCSHDNTVREWDARTNNANCVAQARVPNHILGKNGSLETCSIGGANETILAVSCGEKILFYDRRMIRQGGGGGGEIIKQFEDAHSETVTKLRFHPEKRHILQTSSVDGLTCTFNLFDEIDDENSLVSIGTANAAINDFGFLKSSGISSGNNSGSVSSKNILWALTGIEEIHLFDCDASGTTCGVEIGHVKNAREKAREAAKQAKAAMSARKVSSKPSSSSISKNGLKDMIENGVDYIINVIDGGDSNNHKYYACCGTINGTVGLFPIAYDQNGMKSDTSTQPLTLLAPEYVLPNDSSVNEQHQDGGRDREDLVMQGHGDIVRCLLASSSSSMATSESQNMHLYTGGEDSSVCAWTATTMRGNIIDNNHNGFGGGAMRNSPSSSFRSGRESPY